LSPTCNTIYNGNNISNILGTAILAINEFVLIFKCQGPQHIFFSILNNWTRIYHDHKLVDFYLFYRHQWPVHQLSFIIICNSTWSVLSNALGLWLTTCPRKYKRKPNSFNDQAYHTNKRKYRKRQTFRLCNTRIVKVRINVLLQTAVPFPCIFSAL